MTKVQIIANARLVLANEILHGSVQLRDGLITDMDQGAGVPEGAVDAMGDYLAPGLIELHTDNLERHMEPRPKVNWPHAAAIAAHDAELGSVGITTVFDALRVGSIPDETAGYEPYARAVASEIQAMRQQGALRISHLLHLRAETCSETLADEIAQFTPDDQIGIISLMDHTPGQRQFRDIEKLRTYVMSKKSASEEDWHNHLNTLYRMRATYGAVHEQAVVDTARRLGAVLFSHDDTTADQVVQSAQLGVKVAEFPTTQEAAITCHQQGIAVMMGGPNLVRGGSHSGNIAAVDLARADLLDILSSDYIPASLLMGAVILGDLWGNMARGMACATLNPARTVRLSDRGQLAIGLRADLLRFGRGMGGTPLIRGVWSGGARVA